jgi:hypothetical protein
MRGLVDDDVDVIKAFLLIVSGLELASLKLKISTKMPMMLLYDFISIDNIELLFVCWYYYARNYCTLFYVQ